jgi:hypothetical protein
LNRRREDGFMFNANDLVTQNTHRLLTGKPAFQQPVPLRRVGLRTQEYRNTQHDALMAILKNTIIQLQSQREIGVKMPGLESRWSM